MYKCTSEKILINALEEGRTLTLDELGGISALKCDEETLVVSPLMSYFLVIVLEYINKFEGNDIELAESFILLCFEAVTDEFTIQEAINYLEPHRPFSKSFEDRCFKITLKEAQNCKKPPITRSWSLEGAFRFALDSLARRYQLLSYLVELPVDDEPEYLRHAVKIVGLAYTYWADNNLVIVLEKLTKIDLAEDEAFFELGLASLASALNAKSTDEAKIWFKKSYSQFEQSIAKREHRPDAEAFHAAISILFAFDKNDLHAHYSHNLERLKKSIAIYNIWHKSDAGPAWLMARETEMVNWHMLTTKLEALLGYLSEPSWFEPIIVIEQALLHIYNASRTLLKRNQSGGLETLVQPTIEASLIHNQGQLYVLEKWLERQPPDDLSSIGQELMRSINLTKQEMYSGKELGVAVNFSLLATPLQEIINDLPDKYKSPIDQVLEDCINLQKRDMSPVLERILENCISEVAHIDDYKDSTTKEIFHTILFQTLRFLENRMDMTKKNNPRLKYLFEIEANESLPLESELQMDYYEFMHGNISAGTIKVEVSDIASGRADVYFSFGSIKFITEVKRDSSDCTFSALRTKYIGQASEYQNTNVKLGFLLVLDLTKKSKSAGSIEEHVKVEKSGLPVSNIEHVIVVITVPGRRKTPSKIK
jgi:hypothetical protein